MGAFAEGMALCQAADLPMDTLLQVRQMYKQNMKWSHK